MCAKPVKLSPLLFWLMLSVNTLVVDFFFLLSALTTSSECTSPCTLCLTSSICTHSAPAFYMTHIKHFAGSEKQLLVNKAVYRDSIPWVAAMFSIFGVCVCVCARLKLEQHVVLGAGLRECFLNASESPSSRKITAP